MRMILTAVAWALASMAAFGAEPIAHVETRGEGDTQIVLIHNALADWGVWDSFMERNSDRYTMRAIRLAGMGGSEAMEIPEGDPLDEMVWTDRVVDALRELCAQEEVEDVYVIGHGIGGVIGMSLAAADPDLVAGVVLVDTMPAHPLTVHGLRHTHMERVQMLLEGFLRSTQDLDRDEWRATWIPIARRQADDEAQRERLGEMAGLVEPDTWRRWMTEMQAPDLTDPLNESGVRTLGVAAVNDALVRMFATRVMLEEFWNLAYDGVENAELTFFDASMHYVFLDHPEEFDAMVARFVAGEAQPQYGYYDPEGLDHAPRDDAEPAEDDE